ncbi:MAG TPA: hypothetical protein VNK95_25280, partial [Caldilineaceae bacterium]|nr:hypothetical protein [Caldilineaceae bacterium]
MKSSEFRQITDELLSAYLDNAVTDQERALIEAAVAVEPDIAWRLDSLRQTVMLLRELPELPLPRSFTLQEAQVSDVLVARAAVARRASGHAARAGFWSNFVAGWRSFWQAGNPVLRNAMATSLVLLLLLTGGSQLLSSQFETVGAPIVMAPASAPASRASAAQEAAPASEPAMRQAPAGDAAMAVEAAEPEGSSGPEATVVEPIPAPAPTLGAAEPAEEAAPLMAPASAPAESTAAENATPESDEAAPTAAPAEAQPNQAAGAAAGDEAMAEAAALPPVAEAQPEAAPVPGGGGPPPGAPGMAAFPFDPAARGGGGGGPGMGGAGGGPGEPAVPYAGGLLPPEAYTTDPALA